MGAFAAARTLVSCRHSLRASKVTTPSRALLSRLLFILLTPLKGGGPARKGIIGSHFTRKPGAAHVPALLQHAPLLFARS